MDYRQWALDRGYRFHWAGDWSIGSHIKEYGPGSVYEFEEPDTCEECHLLGADGNTLTSLHCIDDADDDYRRTVESDMARAHRSELIYSNRPV